MSAATASPRGGTYTAVLKGLVAFWHAEIEAMGNRDGAVSLDHAKRLLEAYERAHRLASD